MQFRLIEIDGPDRRLVELPDRSINCWWFCPDFEDMSLPKLPTFCCNYSLNPGLLATDGIGNFDGIFPCICESHPNPGKVKKVLLVTQVLLMISLLRINNEELINIEIQRFIFTFSEPLCESAIWNIGILVTKVCRDPSRFSLMIGLKVIFSWSVVKHFPCMSWSWRKKVDLPDCAGPKRSKETPLPLAYSPPRPDLKPVICRLSCYINKGRFALFACFINSLIEWMDEWIRSHFNPF